MALPGLLGRRQARTYIERSKNVPLEIRLECSRGKFYVEDSIQLAAQLRHITILAGVDDFDGKPAASFTEPSSLAAKCCFQRFPQPHPRRCIFEWRLPVVVRIKSYGSHHEPAMELRIYRASQRSNSLMSRRIESPSLNYSPSSGILPSFAW